MPNFYDTLRQLHEQQKEIDRQKDMLTYKLKQGNDKQKELLRLLQQQRKIIDNPIKELRQHRHRFGDFFLPNDGNRKLLQDGQVTLATGDADGTEFRIFLKEETDKERAIVFASVTGFTRMGFYWLYGYPEGLLEQAASQGPSIHFAQILHGPIKGYPTFFPNKTHEAIVWCTLADDPIIRKYEFKQGFYYSMYYAAIELMIENGYNRIHLAGLNQHTHTSEEVLGGIKSFVHVARQSKIEKLDLVIGGKNYWDLHPGSYDYLETIKAFVQKAIVSEFVPVKTRIDDSNESFKDKRNPGSYYPEVKQFNIQSRILDVPYRLQSV